MAVLLLMPVAFSMAATSYVTITSDDVQGNVGDTVTVTFNIVMQPPKVGQTMDSLQFVLEYNSEALEFVGIQEVVQDSITILGVPYTCNVTTKPGAVAFAAASTDGASGSGALMHVRFKILSAARTMLVLKSVAYSFVTKNGKTQDRGLSGVINLGSITGKSAPSTIAPSSPEPGGSQGPENTPDATDEPWYPVTEVTLAPGASPTADPQKTDNDILAYIVFGLFIVVAILVCVVLTLMIVRRSRNKARLKYLRMTKMRIQRSSHRRKRMRTPSSRNRLRRRRISTRNLRWKKRRTTSRLFGSSAGARNKKRVTVSRPSPFLYI